MDGVQPRVAVSMTFAHAARSVRAGVEVGRGPVVTVGVLVVVTGAYFLAGRLGLSLAFAHASASPVWPPTGLALAATLVLGRRALPAILAGAFLVNVTLPSPVPVSILIAIGNTLEAAVGAFLIERFAGGRGVFEQPVHALRFTVLVAAAAAVSASVGVGALVASGLASAAAAPTVWVTWWLGDTVGAWLFAPFLLLWWNGRAPLTAGRRWEFAALITASAALGAVVFEGALPILAGTPLEFLVFPPVIWAAHRFSPRETATVTLLLSTIAVHGAWLGEGPFILATPNESLLVLQAFMGIVTLIALPLSSVVMVQRRADRRADAARDELEQRVADRTRELSESQEVLASFTENIPGLAWAKDAKGRYVLANPAFAATIGRKPEQVLGATDRDLFREDIAAEYVRNDDTVRRTGVTLRTTEPQPVGGEIRESLVSKFPIPGREGGPLVGGVAIDITEQKRAEAALVRSLREKEALLREIHHRVKNNIQITSSLLALQAHRVHDEATRGALLDSIDRLRSLALVHEKLYGSKDIASVDFGEYIRDLTSDLVRAHDMETRGIHVETDVPPLTMDLDTAMTCGLLLNEMLSNALKHAFPEGGEGHVRIEVAPDPSGAFRMSVIDDGVGIPEDVDIEHATTMGMQLIRGLAQQLDGSATIVRGEESEMRVLFRIKRKPADATSSSDAPGRESGNGT